MLRMTSNFSFLAFFNKTIQVNICTYYIPYLHSMPLSLGFICFSLPHLHSLQGNGKALTKLH